MWLRWTICFHKDACTEKDNEMKPEITISIIVPIYNVEPYLKTCVDSILAQDYPDMEMILADDGSTDGCGALCDAYAERDKRIKVIHKENGGLVSARKAGLEAATGAYVTYVDGDDSVDPDLIGRCVDALKSSGADVLLHGYVKESETERQVKISPLEAALYEGERLDALRKQMLSLRGADTFAFGVEPSVWSKMFKRELLVKHQMPVPDDITIGEDVAVTYPLLASCKSVLLDNDITGYRYRVTPVSMTRSLNPDYFRRISVLYRYLKEVLPDGDNVLYRDQIEDYRFYMITTKTEEIRYRTDMPEEAQIAYLEESAKDADVLDHLEEAATNRFRGEALKRLKHIQNRNWKALYRSYHFEPVKEQIHGILFPKTP